MSPPRLPVISPETQPKTRADCLEGGRNAARPCGWLTCRHSLAAEGSTGESCALDFVEQHPGGASLDAIGQVLGVTRERMRQIESRILTKIGKRAQTLPSFQPYRELALLPDDPPHAVRTR